MVSFLGLIVVLSNTYCQENRLSALMIIDFNKISRYIVSSL